MENGDWLEREEPARAAALRQLPWVADGVADSEQAAAELLIEAAVWYPDTFNVLLRIPWISDGVTSYEIDAIEYMGWTEYNAPALNTLMLQKPWVQDGITHDESVVIKNLYWTARPKDEAFQQQTVVAAIEILAMPFLESVAGADAAAVRSLQMLKWYDTAAFLEIMNHPKLKDGITDDEAKIVALLGGAYAYRPESVDVLLRGTGVYLEERVIQLPLAGETLLAVIRIRNQVTPNMDYLEHSVRTIEEFMGVPFPAAYVALYFDDANVREGGGQGTNFGTHIAMSLDYDVENGRLWQYAPATIAHEVAHYYWRGSSRHWLNEGPAVFIESVSENARVDEPVKVRSNPCASAQTIAELESLAVHRETWRETVAQNWFRCNYSLGERLFLDLYETLGEHTFRPAFRSLYLKSQHDDPADDCEDADLTICHVAAAFKADASPEIAAKVDEIIARWYGPLP